MWRRLLDLEVLIESLFDVVYSQVMAYMTEGFRLFRRVVVAVIRAVFGYMHNERDTSS